MSSKLHTLQAGGSHGGGNHLYRYDSEPGPRFLKVYRRRGDRFGEWVKAMSHVVFERKRGVSAAARRQTELDSLAVWRKHGFDVPATFDEPIPDDFCGEPVAVLEYCPGPSVADIFEDPAVTFERRRDLLCVIAKRMAQRHKLAIDLGEPLLIPEHASIKHVISFGDRLVQIDLECGYARTFSVIEAACQELSGTLRSVARKAEPDFDRLVDEFVPAYGEPEQLAEITVHGLTAKGIYRGFKRWQDAKRRARFSKTDMLRATLARLANAPTVSASVVELQRKLAVG